MIISGSCSRHDHQKIGVYIYTVYEFIRESAPTVSQPKSQNYMGIEAYLVLF